MLGFDVNDLYKEDGTSPLDQMKKDNEGEEDDSDDDAFGDDDS